MCPFKAEQDRSLECCSADQSRQKSPDPAPSAGPHNQYPCRSHFLLKFPPCCPAEGSGSEALTLQPVGASSSDSCQSRFLFQPAEPLTVAGSYTVTAEYTEARHDLARALSKTGCLHPEPSRWAFEMLQFIN